MEPKVERQNNKLKWVVVRFVLAVLLAVALVVFISVREGGRAQELEQALIENCQTSPVREALTEILEEEIKESRGPLLPKVAKALGITLAEAERITSKRDAKKQERIEQIEPSDCEFQFK